MPPLPTSEKLAALVSGVTQTMCGLTFEPDQHADSDALRWLTAVLPIPGERPLTVGISSDQESLSHLSAAMFSLPREEVDVSMMNDSLCEIVNITAGLLKSMMSLDQSLGLPRILAGADPTQVPAACPRVVVLRAERLGLALWIYEGVA